MGGGRYPTGPSMSTGIAALSLSGAAIHDFAVALQGVVMAGVGAMLLSPSLAAPTGKVATLYLLQLCFMCKVARDGNLPLIWESVVR